MTVSSRMHSQPTARHLRPAGESGGDGILAQIDRLVGPYLKTSVAAQGRLPDGRASHRLPSEVPAIRALAEAGLGENVDELIELLVPLCTRFDRAALRARLIDLETQKSDENIEAKIARLTSRIARLTGGRPGPNRTAPGLLGLVSSRRSLLDYLKKKDEARYRKLLDALKIRR